MKLHQFLFRSDRSFFWPAAGLHTIHEKIRIFAGEKLNEDFVKLTAIRLLRFSYSHVLKAAMLIRT
jgi:hypothetical protein